MALNSTPVSSVRPVTGAKVPVARDPAIASKAGASAGQAHPSLAADAAAAAVEPPVDADRVRYIRQAIADGSYRLEPGKTADALIASGASLRRQK
jgi:negative regulator of flagellin synthesis FlgM